MNSTSDEDQQLRTGKAHSDIKITKSFQSKLKNTNSCKASIFIGFSLTTAVLALVVAMMSVGLIQPLTEEMKNIQLSLNQSMNAIDILGHQISAFKTDTATQYGILDQTLNSLPDTIHEHTDYINLVNFRGSKTNPATSCNEIPTDKPSGEYWLHGNSSSIQLYCDMKRTCCNITGGWMRVVNLDMTDPNQQCPEGFLLRDDSTAPLRTCGRSGPVGCMSITFPVHGIEYSRVCGRVIGYQFGQTLGFFSYYSNPYRTIDGPYVDGFSLTHGQLPRKHIWTFASTLNEQATNTRFICSCTHPNTAYHETVPSFVGPDYFCDTGSTSSTAATLHRDHPLWNGQGCGSTTTCCSFNNPPWFCKQLPQPTTDDIELRQCFQNNKNYVNLFLELLDIFVQ